MLGINTSFDARSQGRISPEAIAGKEVSKEDSGYESSDYRLMLRELSDPVEVGLKRRFLNDQIWKMENGENVWVKKYEQEFNENKEGIYKTIISTKDTAEWQEATDDAIRLLQQLQEVVNKEDVNAMQGLRSNMGFVNMSRGGVGYEAGRQLGELLHRFAEERKLTEDAKKEISDSIQTLIRQQISVKQSMAKADLGTRWHELPPEMKAHVWRYYLNFRWSADTGTMGRTAELEVLKRRRGADGRKAPFKIARGSDRQVYEKILQWREIENRLSTEDDPQKRSALQEDQKELEKFVEEYSSSLSGTFDEREELGPVGITQVQQGAWEEIRHIVDKLREGPDAKKGKGKVKKVFLQPTSSYDKKSYEPLSMKTAIYFDFGVTKNALKRLEQFEALAPNDDVRNAFIDNLFPGGNNGARPNLERELMDAEYDYKKMLEEEKELDSQIAARDSSLTKAKKAVKDINAEIKALSKTSPPPAGGAGGGTKGGKTKGSREEILAAIERKREAQAEQSKLEEEIRKLGLEKDRIDEQKKNAEELLVEVPPTAPGDPYLGLRSKDNRQGLQEALDYEFDRETMEFKIKQFNAFLEKVRKFVTENKLEKDFSEYFTGDEIKLIAKLNELEAATSSRTGQVSVSQKLSSLCNVGEKVVKRKIRTQNPSTGEVTINEVNVTIPGTKSDYVFFNMWEFTGQGGRPSPDLMEQMLDNPGAYPEISDLLDAIKNEGRIVVVTSFAPQNDIDGGMSEKNISGAGQAYNFERAEELKKAFGWTDAQLFERWLDDITIQRELGVTPEETEQRYTLWQARNHVLREKHFSAKDGWTFMNVSVSAATPQFFESTIKRMVDAGIELTSEGFRKLPFLRQMNKTNETAYVITDENLSRTVHYRGRDLTANAEAPKTLVSRTFRSLMQRLDLYHKRALIGGQLSAEGLNEEDEMRMGAMAMAQDEMIKIKMMKLRTIHDDPSLNPEERLAAMIKFSEEDMINLSLDFIDENGQFIEENVNSELWGHYNATSQWLGKLKRNLREAELRYSQTESNPHATEQDIIAAEADYLYHLETRRNYEIRQHALGAQLSGRWKNLAPAEAHKEIGKFFAKKHSRITGEQIVRLQEQQMRARFHHDNDFRPIFQNMGRRLVGKLTKNRIADFGRWVGHTYLGVGDRFLREVDINKFAADVDSKFDTEIFKRASAHMAHSIQTGYQNSWWGIFAPQNSSLVHPRDTAADILGRHDVGAPSAQLSPTGQAYLSAMEARIAEDIGDAIDRTIGNNIHALINVGKKRGWNVEEIMKTYLEAEMNDSQEVEISPANGRPQYNMYSKQKTPIALIDQMFMREVRFRLDRSGWTPRINLAAQPEPLDASYVGLNQSDPPVIIQRRQGFIGH